jgi:hypothetical protein
MSVFSRAVCMACLVMTNAFAALPAQAADPHDYPTADRVIFVQACMRDHPGGHYEMLNKCSCALDAIARETPFERFTELSTAANANSIGGERGSYIRDTESLQADIRKFRKLVADKKQGCFINLEAK